MHGIDNTNGIDLDTWYRIATPESHTYERAECYPYAGFFLYQLRVKIKYYCSPYINNTMNEEENLALS